MAASHTEQVLGLVNNDHTWATMLDCPFKEL
jgi:hypothetical protein